MQFDLPKEISSIIKVIGVGGGGSNAVNHMYHQGINGVDFIVCNTDQQALDKSPVPTRIQLGVTLTGGRGAGSKPEVGKNAAIEQLANVLLSENSNYVQELLLHESAVALDATIRDTLLSPLEPIRNASLQMPSLGLLTLPLDVAKATLELHTINDGEKCLLIPLLEVCLFREAPSM